MREILKRYWGYDSFRPMQEEIISSALAGKDTLSILPTGGGKSICFQVPAMMKEGICIVISPLIALMKDQVQSLNDRGIKALAIYSGMNYRDIDITLDNAIYGDYKFLYVSPERVRTELFKSRVAKMNVNYLVVDESHCISQWGYDFRPDYLTIAQIRTYSDILESVPIIALTATATEQVAQDIMDKLDFRGRNIIRSGFERPNLSYVFRKVEDKSGYLLTIAAKVAGTGIVYVGRRKTAEDVASFLQNSGISAHAYHAGMSREMRSDIQDKWKSNQYRIIVATNAFGMGIDKPDVRFVCHYNMPDSIEGYFQEAGRAGRDGNRSYTVLLWNGTDIARLRQITKVNYPPLDYIRDIYQKVFTFLGLPYESGKGMSVKFDLQAFSKRYRLHAVTAYYAIKYIEMAGYWSLTDELDIPSKIQFIVNRDELYRIQLGSEEMDTFIKVVLRLYTGLFSEYVSIDEEYIAKIGRYAVNVVKDKLIRLSRMKILTYIPRIKSPMLNINNERLEEANLRLPQSEYNERVERLAGRVDSMIDLVEDGSECRSVRLLRYFGQESSSPCGICDVCLSKKEHDRRDNPGVEDKLLTDRLLQQCGGDRYKASLLLKQSCIDEEEYNRLIGLLKE